MDHNTTRAEETTAVPAYTGPIVDGDTHLYEQPDAWSRYFPEKFKKDWDYQFKVGDDGEFSLYVGNRKIEVSAGYMTEDRRIPAPGKLHEWLRAMKEGKGEIDLRVPMTRDMTHGAERIQKMDEFGCEISYLYCGHMVSTISYLDNVEASNEIMHAYNRWMLDEWKFNNQGRIYSAPLVSLEDLDWACKEARWAIENGARLLLLPMGPFGGKSPADPYFDPFWSILNEAHCRVVYHVSEAIYLKPHMAMWGERMQESRFKQSAFTWMHGYSERPVVETISSYLFMNFFSRFPNIKILSAENGAEWVPGALTKMDKCRGIAKNGYWACGYPKERPSETFKRHIGVVAYPEDDLQSIITHVGSSEFLIMGSDYPHSEGVPTPRDFVTEACKHLTPEQTRQIMYDNGKSFLGV